MKRRTFLLSTGVLSAGAAGLLGAPAHGAPVTPPRQPMAAPGVPSPVVASRTDLVAVAATVAGISLSGTLQDDRWGSPHWEHAVSFFDLQSRPTGVYAVHDQTHLYLAARITDHAATVTRVSFLIRQPDRAYRSVTATARSTTPTPSFNWGGVSTSVEAESAVTPGEDETIVEISIALADLGISDPVGVQLGLNVVVDHEEQTASASSTAPIRTSDNMYQGGGATATSEVVNQDRVATVVLGSLAPMRGTTPVELGTGEGLTLTYLSYTRKQVAFGSALLVDGDAVTLDWREPGGDWASVAADVQVAARSRIRSFTATFEHPRPVAFGQYELRITLTNSTRDADQVIIATFDRDALIAAGDALPAHQPQPPRGTGTVAAAPPSPTVAALLDLIPERTGFTFCGVPDAAHLHPQNLYDWTVDDPDHITAKSTGTVYPNADYPEDRELAVTNRLGEQVSYPYHEDADGKRYFLSGHVWFRKREHVYANLPDIAETDPLGAARILHRFAEVYQGWVPTNEYPWLSRPVEPGSVPRNYWWGGVWTRWSVSDLRPVGLLAQTMQKVEQTNALDVLSEEVGTDVRELLVQQTLLPSVAYRASFNRRYHNMDYPTYRGLVQLGWALGDASWMHEVAEWAQEYMARGYLFDGFWRETTISYHQQSTNGMEIVANEIAGWTDPEGYESPRTGFHFEDVDLRAQMPALGAASRVAKVLVYPDGHYFPLADTWASSTTKDPEPSAPVFYGAAGVARLARGETQSYLEYTPKYGHNHNDQLGLAMFAEGQELFPDVGYTHTRFRRHTTSTLGHNTVTVDSSDLDSGGEHGGSIEIFDASDAACQVTRASFGTAYPQTSVYQRENWLIQHPGEEDHGYLLDFFRVRGGERHEYVLAGDANHDAEMATEATLTAYGQYLLPEGVTVTEPETENDYGDAEGHYYGYIYVRSVKRAELAEGEYVVDLTTTTEDGQAGAGARIFGSAGGSAELFLGISPSMRATRLNGTSADTNDEAEKYWLPRLVVRREGADLASDFVTAIEPTPADGQARIERIERLDNDGPEGTLAARVVHLDGTIDVVISTPDSDATVTAGGVTLTGKLGFARITSSGTKLHLVGGTKLTAAGAELVGEGPVTGTVTGTTRTNNGDATNAVVTDQTVPDWVAGHTLVVTRPDGKTHPYLIAGVTATDQGSAIELVDTDPGFVVDGESSELVYFPATKWSGATTFRVENAATS
ncbi:heparinase II/III domain-containing protein [Parenemella sanctibonifatiensis]|uniref:Heparinase II/III-like C-terminal domain-containing protein n=1 Tax=Parenemella sanctibonifatiensis TaxID=2016505 RepID=A0A255EF99_9ACTN|nr:heparinase II/III family protein [Parenemella sanctibonifatiensis]OYN89910.1 hypothetical protein CGZ91_10465 [Parenemella sanctibonifatiensis]